MRMQGNKTLSAQLDISVRSCLLISEQWYYWTYNEQYTGRLG